MQSVSGLSSPVRSFFSLNVTHFILTSKGWICKHDNRKSNSRGKYSAHTTDEQVVITKYSSRMERGTHIGRLEWLEAIDSVWRLAHLLTFVLYRYSANANANVSRRNPFTSIRRDESFNFILSQILKFCGLTTKTMSISFQDRLRQLWGPIGTKQISMDAVLPMILLPAMLCIAAINLYWTIIVCLAIPLMLGYAQYVRRNYLPRTKFFFMWAFWSIAYLWILFEMTVPLTELLPEENFIFIATLFGSVILFYKVSSSYTPKWTTPGTLTAFVSFDRPKPEHQWIMWLGILKTTAQLMRVPIRRVC